MAEDPIEYCPRKPDGCPGIIPAVSDRCPTCNTQVPPPNVRYFGTAQQRQALEERYRKAVQRAHDKGLVDELKRLETKLSESAAIANVSYDFLAQLVGNDKTIYATYQQQVRAGTRKPAHFDDDRMRGGIEQILFADFGAKLTYAALSANEEGLISYGPVSLLLRPVAFDLRSTLMEVNSYFFFNEHMLSKGTLQYPLGRTALWQDRVKLGVAKLADELKAGVPDEELNALILSSNGDRGLDKFLEIHIFGTFDNGAVAKIVPCLPPIERRDKVLFQGIRDKSKKLGIEIRNV